MHQSSPRSAREERQPPTRLELWSRVQAVRTARRAGRFRVGSENWNQTNFQDGDQDFSKTIHD